MNKYEGISADRRVNGGGDWLGSDVPEFSGDGGVMGEMVEMCVVGVMGILCAVGDCMISSV